MSDTILLEAAPASLFALDSPEGLQALRAEREQIQATHGLCLPHPACPVACFPSRRAAGGNAAARGNFAPAAPGRSGRGSGAAHRRAGRRARVRTADLRPERGYKGAFPRRGARRPVAGRIRGLALAGRGNARPTRPLLRYGRKAGGRKVMSTPPSRGPHTLSRRRCAASYFDHALLTDRTATRQTTRPRTLPRSGRIEATAAGGSAMDPTASEWGTVPDPPALRR